jgi:ribosomal protein S27E
MEQVTQNQAAVSCVFKCLKCGNEQFVFSHATNKVTCNVCNETLAAPQAEKQKSTAKSFPP